MEDRYLFKAKRVDNGEWVVGYIARYGHTGKEKCYIIPSYASDLYSFLIDENTICQCTGLKDKNGKLIWENDIVKCVDVNAETEFFAVVEFGNPNGFYSWGYQLKHIWGDEPNLDILLWIDMEETGATCEIIGNIFDNPELLESEDKMTESEAKGFIQGKLDCMKKCGVFNKEDNINYNDCDYCDYCYSQGNFGQQKEAFNMAINALEKQEKIKEAVANANKWSKEDIVVKAQAFCEIEKILRSDEE